jgi:hypothetical protein
MLSALSKTLAAKAARVADLIGTAEAMPFPNPSSKLPISGADDQD